MHPHAQAAKVELMAAFVQAIATLAAINANGASHQQKMPQMIAAGNENARNTSNDCKSEGVQWEDGATRNPHVGLPTHQPLWNPLSYDPQFTAQKKAFDAFAPLNPNANNHTTNHNAAPVAAAVSALLSQSKGVDGAPKGSPWGTQLSPNNYACDDGHHNPHNRCPHSHNPHANTNHAIAKTPPTPTHTTSQSFISPTRYASATPPPFAQPPLQQQQVGSNDNSNPINSNSKCNSTPNSFGQFFLHENHDDTCDHHKGNPFPTQTQMIHHNGSPCMTPQHQPQNGCPTSQPHGLCLAAPPSPPPPTGERNGGCCIACGDVNATGDFLRLFRPHDGPDLTLAVVRDGARMNLRIPRKFFANTRYLRVFLKPGMPLKPLTFSVDDVCRRHMLHKCGSGSSCKFLHICTHVWGPNAGTSPHAGAGGATPLVSSLQAPSGVFLANLKRPCATTIRGTQRRLW